MKLSYLLPLLLVLGFASCSTAQHVEKMQKVKKLTKAEYQALKPEDTESYAYTPAKVIPGYFTAPPSDAIVLFDGTDLSKCCLLYTSPSPRDATLSRMPSSA